MSFDKMPNPFTARQEKEYIPKSIPEYECQIEYVRGGGAGGQKVNKTSSTAQLRWHIGRSSTFTSEEKGRIRLALASRVTKDDEIVLKSQEERSQKQNKEAVLARLNELVADALKPMKERVEGEPTKGSKERRLQGKALDSKKKQERRKGDWE